MVEEILLVCWINVIIGRKDMANPESAAERVIHNIRNRLQRAQVVHDTLVGTQSAKERLLAAINRANTPIARTTESVISPERARGIVTRTEFVRDWIVNNAPSYDEDPSSRVDDEEGWAYNGGGFEISADDITKPSTLETPFLLSITESPSIHEQNGQRGIPLEYTSNQRSFEEMPEDDAIIVEDITDRVTAYLTAQNLTAKL